MSRTSYLLFWQVARFSRLASQPRLFSRLSEEARDNASAGFELGVEYALPWRARRHAWKPVPSVARKWSDMDCLHRHSRPFGGWPLGGCKLAPCSHAPHLHAQDPQAQYAQSSCPLRVWGVRSSHSPLRQAAAWHGRVDFGQKGVHFRRPKSLPIPEIVSDRSGGHFRQKVRIARRAGIQVRGAAAGACWSNRFARKILR